MNATVHSVPPELLDHILDLVRPPSIAWRDIDSVPNNSDLLSAALVCRSWAETAQRVLWRDARTILDQSRPDSALPKHKYPLKNLWIAVRGTAREHDQDQDTLNDAMTSLLTTWLDEAPHIMSLCMPTQRATAGPQWSILQSAALSDLTQLDLEYCENVQEPLEILTPFQFHLTHLGLTLYPSPPSSHLVRALFSASRDTLTSLRLSISSDEENDREARTLLKEELNMVASRLEKLVVDYTCHNDGAEYLDLTALVGLKELGLLLSFSDQSSLFGEYYPVAPYLDQITAPSTLLILATYASDVKQVLAHSALDQLVRLEVIYTGEKPLEWEGEESKRLMEECEQRGIALVFREGLL
ncbi:hypothetical protein RQP46_003709 [Phenoliferia psychrophenolica]